MPNWQEPDWLLGRRFTADFTVVARSAGGDMVVLMRGALYVLGVDELNVLIERGLVDEAAPGRSES